MNTCEYLVASGMYKKVGTFTAMPELIPCGKPAIPTLLPTIKLIKKFFGNRKQVCLCEEHRAFSFDAIRPPEAL